MLIPGAKLGPYSLVKPLGKGSFGFVWLAEKQTLLTKTEVALKLMHNATIDHESVAQEAALWVKASGHPNVLPIIEADCFDDEFVIVSEYASGGTLAEFLAHRNGNPLPPSQILELVGDILKGLTHLHQRSIIHRDLKPANILFQGGIPRIADFGISRFADQDDSKDVAGTFSYMAPEAFTGIRNEQTDIWSMGVILYELICLRRPFRAPDLPSLVRLITDPDAPPEWPKQNFLTLNRIAFKALEKNPSNRYRSADEMLADLRSDVARFELILKPTREEPEISSNVIFPADTEFLTEPRPQHYEFSTSFLRERAFSLNTVFVEDLQRSSGQEKLEIYWGLNARGVADKLPYIQPNGLACVPVNAQSYLQGVLIMLPRPVGFLEAFFVAIILIKTMRDQTEHIECRYYTLDLGQGRDGELRTVFSEWSSSDLIYSDPQPVDDVLSFWSLVQKRIPSYKNAIKDRGVIYPFIAQIEYTFINGSNLSASEVDDLTDLICKWNDGATLRALVFPVEGGFRLQVFCVTWVTRQIERDLFIYLTRNFFARRGGGVRYSRREYN